MKTFRTIGEELSKILLLALLILYGGQNVRAESPVDVSLATTAGWWSEQWGESRSIAWGDVDSDGDLDLAVANANNEATHLYMNIDGVLETEASWSTAKVEATYSVAWGDVDGDGDLDLAVGNIPEPRADSKGQNQVYLNQDGKLDEDPAWSSVEEDITYSIAWSDVDNDGDLDLAVGNHGVNRVYLNQRALADVNENDTGIYLEETASWSSEEISETWSVTWGDLDNDGDLDLAAGNRDAPNHVYLNVQGRLQEKAFWQSEQANQTQSVAWADVDNNGYLDLMAGNDGKNQLYFNKKGRLESEASWSTEEMKNTYTISWGDLDNDGDLDLAIGNGRSSSGSESSRSFNQLYINRDGELEPANWLSDEADKTYSVVWGDVDGDGDLDLATGSNSVRRIYYNEGNVLQPTPAWSVHDRTKTTSVAWGDMDGDGDLDLAVGNLGGVNRVYLNDDRRLQSIGWEANISDATTSIAWGDVDDDGDLDLAVGNQDQKNYVYRNLGGMLEADPSWISEESENTTSIAWGDMDSDDDLDLAVGNGAHGSTRVPNRVYLNEGKGLEKKASWFSETKDSEGRILEEDVTHDIAWGDLDGDGDLDLAAGNGGVNRVYLNDNDILQPNPIWTSIEEDQTTSVAWGDVDNDGDLDLAIGNEEKPNRIYLNDGDMLQPTAYWSSSKSDDTEMLGWGDVNGDGNLDLAVGNNSQPNRVYININGELQKDAAWNSNEEDKTTAVAWGDVDNDGDLDLAVGNDGQSHVYVGRGRQQSFAESAYIRIDLPSTTQNLQSTEIGATADTASLNAPADFYATTQVWKTMNIPVTYTFFDPSGKPARFVEGSYSLDGGGNWLPAIPSSDIQKSAGHTTASVYNTYLEENMGIEKNRLNSYDVLPSAVPKFSHISTLPAAQPYHVMLPLIMTNNGLARQMPPPINERFIWDTLASGYVGPSDNAVFRIKAHLTGVNSFQRATVDAQTYPFRIRSPLQPQVQTEPGINPGQALVYRLPQGQSQGAEPFANNSGTPYHTDQKGLLQGRGELVVGDRLMAMLPTSEKPKYSGPYRIFATSAKPTANGLEFHTVERDVEQILKVSMDNPLILFDLDISLEWDARSDHAFREQLVTDLKRTSSILYDWTNGQAALGQINIYQDREKWNAAHIRIYASSTLRPNADIGGIVKMLITETVTLGTRNYASEPIPNATPTVSVPALTIASINTDPDISPEQLTTKRITYGPGQVRMGALWNRFGDASGGTLSEDWPRTLAHELGHYLFFLNDNYIGRDNDGELISINNCVGAMSDPYKGEDNLGYDEFHPDDSEWENNCGQTFSNLRTGRSDWSTISEFYPWLNIPKDKDENNGPNILPLEVTQVEFEPLDSVQAGQANSLPLESPIFFVKQFEDNISYEPGPQARAILFQESSNWLIDLGRPELDQIYARGARKGDRICVIDSYDTADDRSTASHLMGCREIQFGDEQIELQEWTDWQPEVVVQPIHIDTIEVRVQNVDPSIGSLKARFYPKNDPAGLPETMDFDPETNSYLTTFNTARMVENQMESDTDFISVTALSGHIHIWVDELELQGEAETWVPRREMVASYSIGGSFAFQIRGYAYAIRGYTNQIRGYAPIASTDGHVMVFSRDDEIDNGIYTIQTATYVPPIPPEATLIGQGYRLISADEDAQFSELSISMGYLGREVPPGQEMNLTIYHLNDGTWKPLGTRVDAHQNNAVAKAPGPGLYALMVRVAIPLNGPDWNIIAFPVEGMQDVEAALRPIADKYQVLYHYDPQDKANPWQIHGPDLPLWFGSMTDTVENFEFGEVYWIYATEPVTWFVRSEAENNNITSSALAIPPAVYYGTLPSIFQTETTVTAWVNGNKCGTTQAKNINDTEVAFVIDVIDNFAQAGCGSLGSNVTFQVGEDIKGSESEGATGNAIWDNSRIQEINLTIAGK